MYKITITILAIVFLFLGCDKKENNTTQAQTKQLTEEKNTKPEESKPTENKSTQAIKFNIKTIDGKEFHLIEIDNGLEFKEIKDKPIFLIFFGHRCPPCLREIPELIELTKEHKDLAIVAFEVQGLNSNQLKEFAKRKGINYNLVTLDNSMEFVNYIQARAGWGGSIPFLIGLNKKGRVEIIHVGGVAKEQLEVAYKDLSKE